VRPAFHAAGVNQQVGALDASSSGSVWQTAQPAIAGRRRDCRRRRFAEQRSERATDVIDALQAARQRTLTLLTAYEQALGPALRVPFSPQLNPPQWEVGHIGWFQDYWIARNTQRTLGEGAYACYECYKWGQLWEWTASRFLPYPAFRAQPYRDYSAPWFDSRFVLRGASQATALEMRHPRYRNYFTPERNDIFSGFRSCTIAG